MTKIVEDRAEWGSSAAESRAVIKAGPYSNNVLVLSSGTARATYQGDTANAGVRLMIDNGQTPVYSDSTEARASNMTFTTAASANRVLPAGESVDITAAAAPVGSGAQSGRGFESRVELHVICLNID